MKLKTVIEKYKGEWIIFVKNENDEWENKNVRGKLVLHTKDEKKFWKILLEQYKGIEVYSSYMGKDDEIYA